MSPGIVFLSALWMQNSTQISSKWETIETDWPLFLVLGKVSCELNWVILLWQMTGPLIHIQCWRKKWVKKNIHKRCDILKARRWFSINSTVKGTSQQTALQKNKNYNVIFYYDLHRNADLNYHWFWPAHFYSYALLVKKIRVYLIFL